MPRDHARFQTAIWRDQDWRSLPWEAQWAYKMLASQESLTYAGVLDYRPGRLAALASNTTARKVDLAVKRLEADRFVIIDHDTEELLIRSYVRHDGVMDRSNMGKAVARALNKVVSLAVRRAVLHELSRLYEQNPTLAGWDGFGELNPDDMATVTAMSSTIPLPIASRKA